MIGILERSLIFVLVISDQPEAIGFVIAAKSIVQFSGASDGISARQYILIGTFASFTWALLGSYGTLLVLEGLPELGIFASPP